MIKRVLCSSFLKFRLFLLFFLVSVSFFVVASPSKEKSTSTEWNFIIAPYGWLSSLSADMNVRGVSDSIFIPASKILQHVDFVGEMHLEANRGSWTFMLDPTYIKLSDSRLKGPVYIGPSNRFVIGPVTESLTSQMLLVDGGVFYKILTRDQNTYSSSLELLGGGRLFGLKNSISVEPRRVELFPGISVSDTTNVITPIIGARAKYKQNKMRLWLKADVGGFSIDSVKYTYEAAAGVSYAVSKHIDLALAYRVLKINIRKSDALQFSMLLNGPEAGIIFSF